MTTALSVDGQFRLMPVNSVETGARSTAHDGILPELFASSRPVETLQTVVRIARQSFRCDGAAVGLTRSGGIASTVASDAATARADALQVEHHQGPAFAAVAARQPIVSAELRFESAWRFWGPMAADLGFRSVLALPLAEEEPFGALTLYSRHPSSFTPDLIGSELRFAQQASIAVSVAVEREQLVQARDSRGIVGQAQGILMERYRISADQAFAVLRRYSSQLNVKLRLVAEQVIRDRTLPEPGPKGKPYQA